MPRTRTRPNEQLRQIFHQVADIAISAVPTDRTKKHISNTSRNVRKIVDQFIEAVYGDAMKKTTEYKETTFGRAMIASQYGISPSEVTDEFLKRRRDEAKKEGKRIFATYEFTRGIRLRPDTPEYRGQVIERAKKIITADIK